VGAEVDFWTAQYDERVAKLPLERLAMIEQYLVEAQKVLDGGRGWIQGSLANSQGVCLLGSVSTRGYLFPFMDAVVFLRRALITTGRYAKQAETFRVLGYNLLDAEPSVSLFNDGPETRWEDVERVLTTAIEDVRDVISARVV